MKYQWINIVHKYKYKLMCDWKYKLKKIRNKQEKHFIFVYYNRNNWANNESDGISQNKWINS